MAQYALVGLTTRLLNLLKLLILAQKHAIRILFNKRKLDSTLPLFRKANILPVRYHYVYKVLKIFYDRSGSRDNSTTSYNLRVKNRCKIPLGKTQHYTKYFLTTAPRLYNQLPNDLKNCSVKSKFLKDLKQWLLDKDNIEPLFIPLT